MRVCSGKLSRGMKAKLVRTGKPISLSAPQFFYLLRRQGPAIARQAYAATWSASQPRHPVRNGDT